MKINQKLWAVGNNLKDLCMYTLTGESPEKAWLKYWGANAGQRDTTLGLESFTEQRKKAGIDVYAVVLTDSDLAGEENGVRTMVSGFSDAAYQRRDE